MCVHIFILLVIRSQYTHQHMNPHDTVAESRYSPHSGKALSVAVEFQLIITYNYDMIQTAAFNKVKTSISYMLYNA